jgi:PAS domain S-box-containing protein
MKQTVLLILLFFSTQPLFSQSISHAGNKEIKYYSADELNVFSQSWSIIQGDNGLIYVGNSSGILEYDGVTWNLIPTDGTIRCFLKAADGKIYCGGDNNLGMIYPDKNNKTTYLSLIDSIPKDKQDFFAFLSVFEKDGLVYFIGLKGIYIFKNQSLQQIIRPEKDFRYAFMINNHIFVRQSGMGLFEVMNDKVKLCGGGEFFADKNVYSMLQLANGNILIGTGEFGLFKIAWKDLLSETTETSIIKTFDTPANEYLKVFKIYHGAFTIQNNIAFSTSAGGVVIIKQDGKIFNIFNKSNGLKYNSVNYSYTDRENNLWVALQNGIVKIEMGSPLSFFPNESGTSGLLFSMYKKDNVFWIGATEGLYRFTLRTSVVDNNQSLVAIDKINKGFYSFLKIDTVDNDIIAAARKGLFMLRNDQLIPISENEFGFMFYHYKKNPNVLFVSNLYGVFVFLKVNGKWTSHGQVQGISHEIRTFYETSDGKIWLNTVQGKLPCLTFTENNYTSPKVDLFDFPFTSTTMNNSVGPESRLNHMTINNSGKMLAYNEVLHRFESDKWFPSTYLNDSIKYINICLYSDSLIYSITDKGIVKTNISGKKPVLSLVYPGYNESVFFTYPDPENNTLWFSNAKGLYSFNTEENSNNNKEFTTCIRKIIIGKDSLIFDGQMTKPDYNFKIPFDKNSMAVDFAALWFERSELNEYSYFLEGFDKDWSKWAKETKVNYSFLPAGDYVYKVKARNYYGIESAYCSFKIHVESPWFTTLWAYIIYLLLAFVLVYIIIRINNARLKRANIRLENTITLRTTEIEKQKNEIELKNLQLQIINRELEKLSIVARETDNAIMIMDATGKFEWLNDGFIRLNGYDLQSLVSERSDNLLEYSKNETISTFFNDCVNNKKTVIYEADVCRKDGSVFWAQTTLTPILNSDGEVEKIVAIDSDISQLKRAQEEITKQKEEIEEINSELEKLSIVARETDNVVMIMDKTGKYEWINESLKKMYGYSPEEFYSMKGGSLQGTSFSDEIKSIWDKCIQEKKSVVYQAIVSHVKGYKFWTQTTLTPILNDKGEVLKVIGIDTDITRIKEAEEKIKVQSEELSSSLAELQKKSLLISQSIDYAEKIQKAILPSEKHFREIFPDSFILLLPRDIVSGDFYWFYKVGTKHIVVAADCTGHGVPGAFMSLIGNSLLNEQVKVGKAMNPALILEQLNEKVIEILRQDSGNDFIQEDGMDMAILVFDSEEKQLTFAGANMPLILYNSDGVVKVSGDLFSVGGSFSTRGNARFKNQTFKTENFNGFFLYSDGFQDQFGGTESRKYMADNFVKFLNSIALLSPVQQKEKLLNAFEEWKGDSRQVDDVLILGGLFENISSNDI